MAERSNYSIVWGIILILLGLFMIALPVIAVGIAAIILGLFIIFRSLAVFAGRRSESGTISTGTYVLGILGIIIGILILISPLVSVVALAILLAVGLVFVGIADLIRTFAPAMTGTSRAISFLLGILALIFAGIIFVTPLIAIRTLVQIAGIFAVIFGILDIIVGYYAYRGGRMRTPEVRTVAPTRPTY
jgi:uncharacterized membrane protein HdeD (DUF308 family)